MRRINLIFLAILLAGVTLLGGGIYLLHGIQMRRNASALLDHARRAEAAQDLQKAEEAIDQYLHLKHEDGTAWAWYARIVDERNTDRRRREKVFLVQEQALRYNAGDWKLERGVPISPWSYSASMTPGAT